MNEQKTPGVFVDDYQSEVFTERDRAELDGILGRYLPGGETVFANRVESLRRRLRQSPKDRTAIVQQWLAEVPEIPDAEYDRLKALRDHAHASKTAEIPGERYSLIEANVAEGLMGRADADDTLSTEQRAARGRAIHDANNAVIRLGSLQGLIDSAPEASMTDDAKQAAIDAFADDDAWEQAKARYRELYWATEGIRERAQLSARHPELHAAAIGR